MRGPAGAVIMSMRRAEWTWPAWHAKKTGPGYVLDLRTVCPMDVAMMRKSGVQAKLWADWTCQEEYKDLSPAPFHGTSGLPAECEGLPEAC